MRNKKERKTKKSEIDVNRLMRNMKERKTKQIDVDSLTHTHT